MRCKEGEWITGLLQAEPIPGVNYSLPDCDPEDLCTKCGGQGWVRLIEIEDYDGLETDENLPYTCDQCGGSGVEPTS